MLGASEKVRRMTGSAIPDRLVVMGVAGCGKSTIGALLAERLGAVFMDGDDYHPPENRAKMSAGKPLEDADRWPWLDRMAAAMEEVVAGEGRAVLACSALRRSYRRHLAGACGADPVFIHLDGSFELISGRMAARQGHFMPVSLLESQFATLEPLSPDEPGFAVQVDLPAPELAGRILSHWQSAGVKPGI